MAYPSNRADKIDWYRAVRRDATQLDAALLFFEEEHTSAMTMAELEGRIMDAAKFHPGHMARFGFYAQQTKNLAAYFEYQLKKLRSTVLRDLGKNPPANVRWGANELKQLVDSEPSVEAMEELYQTVQYMADIWMDFATNFKDRSYQINNATRLQTSNNAEAEFERDY